MNFEQRYLMSLGSPATGGRGSTRYLVNADNADDYYEFWNGGSYVSMVNYFIRVGVDATAEYWGGIKFRGVAIPQGATVASAQLNMQKYGGSAGTNWGSIFGVDEDTAPAWTVVHPKDGTKTTASVPVPNASGNIDVTAIVQEIVDRVGWTTGNTLGFIFDRAGADAFITFYDYDQGASFAGTLTITLA